MKGRAPELSEFLKSISPTGMSPEEAIDKKKCVWCNNDIGAFRDDLSKKEWIISGMCQACQDKAFPDVE